MPDELKPTEQSAPIETPAPDESAGTDTDTDTTDDKNADSLLPPLGARGGEGELDLKDNPSPPEADNNPSQPPFGKLTTMPFTLRGEEENTNTEEPAIKPIEEPISADTKKTDINENQELKIENQESRIENQEDGKIPLQTHPTPPLEKKGDSVPSCEPLTPLAEKFVGQMKNWREGLAKANAKRKANVKQRLERIIEIAKEKGGQITNLETQKAFRCSQHTAYVYLKTLEKQNRLKRTGGHNRAVYELIK